LAASALAEAADEPSPPDVFFLNSLGMNFFPISFAMDVIYARHSILSDARDDDVGSILMTTACGPLSALALLLNCDLQFNSSFHDDTPCHNKSLFVEMVS
jgi:hypothetical protein